VAAGNKAETLFRCLDSFGNPLREGGTSLGGQFVSQAEELRPEPQSCEVADMGNGLYALSYCLQAAGQYEVISLLHINSLHL